MGSMFLGSCQNEYNSYDMIKSEKMIMEQFNKLIIDFEKVVVIDEGLKILMKESMFFNIS